MDRFSKYHFKDLNGTEIVVDVLHRNWFYLLEQYFFVIIMLIVFFVGSFLAPLFFSEVLEGQYAQVIAFMKNFFLLAIWTYSFLIWIDYYFDIWIITTERIINIEQKGLFTRSVSELRFSKIQDVVAKVSGFLPTIINFGDVRIQTAGEKNEFLFCAVSDPYRVKNVIMELQKKIESKKVESFGEMISEKMQEL